MFFTLSFTRAHTHTHSFTHLKRALCILLYTHGTWMPINGISGRGVHLARHALDLEIEYAETRNGSSTPDDP